MELIEAAVDAAEGTQAAEEVLKRLKGIRQVVVPTRDDRVKQVFRRLGEPIILFGEDAPERRTRLRELMYDRQVQLKDLRMDEEETMDEEAENPSESQEHSHELSSAARAEWIAYQQELIRSSILRLRAQHRSPSPNRSLKKEALHLKWELESADRIRSTRPMTCMDARGSWVAVGTRDSSWSLYRPGHGFVADAKDPNAHSAALTDLCFFGDARVASVSLDGRLSLWDLNARRETAIPCVATALVHEGGVSAVAATAAQDGALTVGRDDGRWTLTRWAEVQPRTVAGGHCGESAPRTVACHGHGALVAWGGDARQVSILDLRTGRVVLALRGHAGAVTSVDFSPPEGGGAWLASASMDHTVRVWDLRARRCEAILPAHFRPTSDVRFDSSASMLASVGLDGAAVVWRRRSDAEIWARSAVLPGTAASAARIAWICDDSEKFATASSEGVIRVWTSVAMAH